MGLRVVQLGLYAQAHVLPHLRPNGGCCTASYTSDAHAILSSTVIEARNSTVESTLKGSTGKLGRPRSRKESIVVIQAIRATTQPIDTVSYAGRMDQTCLYFNIAG